jgi:hypothetical protein
MKAIGGGVRVATLATGNVADSYPETAAPGWTAHVYAVAGSSAFTVTASCVPAS